MQDDKLPGLDFPLVYRDRVVEIPNDTVVFRKSFKGGSFAEKKSAVPEASVEDGTIYGVVATTKLLPDDRNRQEDEDNNETNAQIPPTSPCDPYTGQSATLVISGVSDCPSGDSPVNGTHAMTYEGYFPPSGSLLGFCLWIDSTATYELAMWDDGTWGAQTDESGSAFVSADFMTSTGGGGVAFGDPIPNAQTCAAGGGTGGQATFSFP